MRNVLCALLLLTSSIANAQTTTTPAAGTPAAKFPTPSAPTAKPFRVNLAVGYALPSDMPNDNSKGGFMYSIEPQYVLIPHVEVGLRLEQAFIQRPEFLDNARNFVSKASSTASAALTANYVTSAIGKFRPYIGVGVGFYHVDPSEQTSPTINQNVRYPLAATNTIGGLARIGVKLGPVNLEGAYNLINDTSVTNTATGLTVTAKNSYVSVKAGFTIGRGIK